MLKQRIDEWLKDTSKRLDIARLMLTKWPATLEGKEHLIVELDCEHNYLTFLPPLPNCEALNCSFNKLIFLPPLPNCEALNCGNNRLTSLPLLPKFKLLVCNSNNLTSLPPLPECRVLSCNCNNLTSLPPLPKCKFLDCNNNELTYIPSLPNCEELWCSGNKLTSLPPLPKCEVLFCWHNNLFSTSLKDWKKLWKLREFYLSIHRDRGIQRFLKIVKLCLHLPRKNDLHLELQYSPNHCGKFYKGERWSNKWNDSVEPELKNVS